MIVKYRQQSLKCFALMGGALIAMLVFIVLTYAINNSPLLEVFIAAGFVASVIAVIILYFRASLFLARAKGYSSAVFLTFFFAPLLLLFLPDKSNPARVEEDERYAGARCVACDARIAPSVKICPQCGWTQPALDTVMS